MRIMGIPLLFRNSMNSSMARKSEYGAISPPPLARYRCTNLADAPRYSRGDSAAYSSAVMNSPPDISRFTRRRLTSKVSRTSTG